MMKIKLLAALAAVALALPAVAQAAQEARTPKGTQSGQLTAKADKVKCDAKVTKKERQKPAQ